MDPGGSGPFIATLRGTPVPPGGCDLCGGEGLHPQRCTGPTTSQGGPLTAQMLLNGDMSSYLGLGPLPSTPLKRVKYAIPIQVEHEPKKPRVLECYLCNAEVADQKALCRHFDAEHPNLSLEDGTVFKARKQVVRIKMFANFKEMIVIPFYFRKD